MRGFTKYGIGHMGAGKISELCALKFYDGRGNDFDFLPTERAFFARVWIESADRDAWRALQTMTHVVGEQTTAGHDGLGGQLRRNFCQWYVNGRQCDGEMIAGEAHRRLMSAESFTEKFRLPGVGKADGLQGVLRYRTRNDSIGAALFQTTSGFFQGIKCDASGLGVRFTFDRGFGIF